MEQRNRKDIRIKTVKEDENHLHRSGDPYHSYGSFKVSPEGHTQSNPFDAIIKK